MRILEVSYTDPECHCGGVEDFILNLIIQMTKKGHEVTCIFSQYTLPNSTEVDYRKINIFNIKKPRAAILSLMHKIVYNIAILLYVTIHRKEFDAIHINGDNGIFLPLFYGSKSVATFFGMPIFRVRETYKNTHSVKNLPRLVIALISSLIHVPSILFSKFVVADNPQIRGILNIFRDFKSVKLVYNSVDNKAFKRLTIEEKRVLRKELGMDVDKKYAIWVGNDAKGYGQDVAFYIAMKHKQDLNLLSIGAHSSLQSDNIIQLGRLDHNTLAKYMGASDFMIFPQRYPGISLSMVSAMLSGLKVVTFSKYISDFFTTDNVFFATTPDDMEKIVSKILENPAMIDTCSKPTDPVLQEFYPENCAKKYLDLYEGLYE